MPAELYKTGIIEVDEDIDFTEEEELWDITVHFNGEIFTPKLVCASESQAFEIGKKLYDWLENNHRQARGFEFRWRRYSVERITSRREYPCCCLPYYLLEDGLEVFTVPDRDLEAIAYGWSTGSHLPYYMSSDGLMVNGVTDDAFQAGWCPAWELTSF